MLNDIYNMSFLYRDSRQSLNIIVIFSSTPPPNPQYYEYLQESGFQPTDAARWVMHWGDNGKPSPSQMDTPVTYVSLNDARAMCKHRKMRLPDVHEWTYLAQGADGRRYPWGNIWNDSFVPAISHNFTNPGPEPVGRYPLGASPYGVEDLVQSVWQLTTEFEDDHTR